MAQTRRSADQVTARNILLMTVKGNQTIVFFDEETGEKLAAPVVGTPQAKPHEIILSADGTRAFASLYGDKGYGDNTPSNGIAVIDVAAMALERTIDLGLYFGPHGMARDHLGRIWVTVEENQCVLIIDPTTAQIARSVYTEQRCHFLSASPDGKTIYAGHKELPFISVIDAEQAAVTGRIALDIGSQALWHAPDAAVLYAGDFCRPMFHVIDTDRREVVRSVPLKGVPGWPYATPDGRHLVVTTYIEDEDRGFVEIFDAASFTPLHITELPAEPFHALACENGLHCRVVVGDGRLITIDIASGALLDRVDHGGAEMPEQVVRARLPR